MKKILIIAIFTLFLATPSYAELENGPSIETIKSAVQVEITKKNGNETPPGGSWRLKNFEIDNEYTLNQNGEKVYCYDIKCKYTPSGFEEGFMPYFPFSGVIQVVKRGSKWYEY